MIALPAHLVRLGARPGSREEAIRAVASLLEDGGHVGPGYAESMLAREREATTFLGNGIAIPHGTPAGRGLVAQTGIAVLQVPDGVDWGGGQAVRLVVGIAAKGDEHLDVLRRLTRVLGDAERVDALARTHDVDAIVAALGGEPAGGTAAPHAPDLPFVEEVPLP
ncbi:MAG: PTS sugar transporter subunit IIA, partial [Myxococcota bacterium]